MSDSDQWAATALEATLLELFDRNAAEFPDQPALTDDASGRPRTWTWAETRDEVRALAAGLAELGLQAGQTMMIMAPNRAEHWLADVAATHLGAVPSTVYDTLGADQVLSNARHCRARVAVLRGADQIRRWSAALREVPTLEHVVLLDEEAIPREESRFLSWRSLLRLGERRLREDPELLDRQQRKITPSHPVTVLYTSGTTDAPEGVVLTHRNVVFAAASLRQIFRLPAHFSTICYLPLAHIAQRVLAIYCAIHDVGHVHFCADPGRIGAALVDVRPHVFFGVPRVWEKLAVARRTAKTGPHQVTAAQLGLDRLHWSASGAAPIGHEVLESFAELGVEVLELWGMTETAGCVTTNRPSAPRIGTVGQVVPGAEIRTDADGEVLVRGPIVCAGYLQPDGAIQSLTDADGWLRTGDVGRIDEDGYLTITDRKKELITTSCGKNIAPSAVETALRAHPLIGQALVYGDRRPYLVALLVLDEDTAPVWARARGIRFSGLAELAGVPEVLDEVREAVAAANARLPGPEQVRHHHLLPRPWGVESGELTPTSKLRRHVIHDRYAEVLDALYR